MSYSETEKNAMGNIAIVGGGPAALVMAIALARRGINSKIFEKDLHPDMAPRFNPDRSYTIDTSGHGLRALRHIEATSYFDARVNKFKGIKVLEKFSEDWNEPGWTGSRGDILRALTALIQDRHRDQIAFFYETKVHDVNIQSGTVLAESKTGSKVEQRFDLVIGGDGAGSVVRGALERQFNGFTVVRKSFPMYCTMIELDKVNDQLDPNFLQMFSIAPFVVAGAIRGDSGIGSSRWFCAICTNKALKFSSAEEATQYLRTRSPRVLEFVSQEKMADFAKRESHHIGRTLTCSQFYGEKVVLLGDAAAPFPPIGQGLNAALESSMVLDQCIGETGYGPAGLLKAAKNYNVRWKPEAEAVAWIAERHLAENWFHNLRSRLSLMLFGLNVVGETKRSDISYSDVKRKAQQHWPWWF